MSQPLLSKLDTWGHYEKRFIAILVEALLLLQNKPVLPDAEISINRELYFCIAEANRKMHLIGLGVDQVPTEAKNPPSPDDLSRQPSENKIPDFTWGFYDNTEIDPKRSARVFTIECKRLGKALSKKQIFTSNYILEGVLRFITYEHGYAKGERSGAMVGYIQNMDLDDILKEVNDEGAKVPLSSINLDPNGWQFKGVSKLIHELDRSFASTHFLLQHFWIDLRHCYP